LRHNVPGVTKVILLGHSMGGPMMAFYANVAENSARACQSPQRIIPCDGTNLVNVNGQSSGLPPVDGMILSDSHPGDALATFTYMDPAIANPAEPGARNPALDMFAAANGYPGDEAAGAPHFRDAQYSAAFSERFFAAQAARNADVLKKAEQMVARISAGDRRLYPDDMLITVPGADGAARLLQADLDLWKCTKRAHIFLTRDGRRDMSPGPICSVRPPSASFTGPIRSGPSSACRFGPGWARGRCAPTGPSR
jgi:pimeloyl-ACP methyl ester carboxylesterase